MISNRPPNYEVLLFYYSIVCGVFLQGVFPHLDADEADAFVLGGGELTTGYGSDTQPVTSSQLYSLAVNDGLTFA